MNKTTYPPAYIHYLVQFHTTRDYFECHEILEEYWKQVEPTNRSSIWVAFIQLAVALYHHRIGNIKGALRLCSKAIQLFQQQEEHLQKLGIDPVQFLHILQTRLEELRQEKRYYSFSIPITDKNLLQTCKQSSIAEGTSWNRPSDLTNEYVLYKHKLRDRTNIVKERMLQLQKRRSERRHISFD